MDGRPIRAVSGTIVEAGFHVERQVHVHVGEVQKEGFAAGGPHHLDRMLDIAAGQHRLVGLLFDHGRVAHERQGWIGERWHRKAGLAPCLELFLGRLVRLVAHVVGVRQPEPCVEAVFGGKELGLVAAVPLPDDVGAVASRFEHRCDGGFGRVESVRHAGKEHPVAVEVVEPDAAGVATGQH